MSAIARIAFNIDALRHVIPEGEGNYIIDSYFRYIADDRRDGTTRTHENEWKIIGDDGDSVCTDDCGMAAKNAMKAAGDQLEEEADASLNLRIAARKKYAERYGGEVFDAPLTTAENAPIVVDDDAPVVGSEYEDVKRETDCGNHPSLDKTVVEELHDMI